MLGTLVRRILGQRQGDPQARQWRAQFVGDVAEQSLLGLHTRLQLPGHAVEVTGQLVGLIAATRAHVQSYVEVPGGQLSRRRLQRFQSPRQQSRQAITEQATDKQCQPESQPPVVDQQSQQSVFAWRENHHGAHDAPAGAVDLVSDHVSVALPGERAPPRPLQLHRQLADPCWNIPAPRLPAASIEQVDGDTVLVLHARNQP